MRITFTFRIIMIVCLVGFLVLSVFGTSQFITYNSTYNLYLFDFRQYFIYLNSGVFVGIDKLRGMFPLNTTDFNFFTIVFDIVATLFNIIIFVLRLPVWLIYNILVLLGVSAKDVLFMQGCFQFLTFNFEFVSISNSASSGPTFNWGCDNIIAGGGPFFC